MHRHQLKHRKQILSDIETYWQMKRGKCEPRFPHPAYPLCARCGGDMTQAPVGTHHCGKCWQSFTVKLTPSDPEARILGPGEPKPRTMRSFLFDLACKVTPWLFLAILASVGLALAWLGMQYFSTR